MEILSRMLDKARDMSKLQGIQPSVVGGPKISHLLYADDILLFGQASLRNLSASNSALTYSHRAQDRL